MCFNNTLVVCITALFSRQDKTRPEGTSQLAKTMTRLLLSDLVVRENSVKILEKYGTGWDYSVPLGNSWMVLKSNLGIPVSFLGLRRDGKWPVLNGQELYGTGSVWSWVLGMENFLDFPGKNWYPKNETADLYNTQGNLDMFD